MNIPVALANFFSTEDAMVNFFIEQLRIRGYSINRIADGPWETPKEFCGRLDLNAGSFSRSLARGNHPYFQANRGPSGRLIELRSNPEFEEWAKAIKSTVGAAP
jgi:hypothetical protein